MKLLTKEIIKTLPKLYSTENETDPVARVKLFTPDSNWSWYILEYDQENRSAFGYVCGFENELGYFSLDELEHIRGPLGLALERDVSFTPTRLSELKKLCHAN
jgi:hypothetical protein